MKYSEAIKTPKEGWKYANDAQMLAALSRELGRWCCLQPAAVFEWAEKHSSYPKLHKATERLMKNTGEMELLVAVINDQPLGCPCP